MEKDALQKVALEKDALEKDGFGKRGFEQDALKILGKKAKKMLRGIKGGEQKPYREQKSYKE